MYMILGFSYSGLSRLDWFTFKSQPIVEYILIRILDFRMCATLRINTCQDKLQQTYLEVL